MVGTLGYPTFTTIEELEAYFYGNNRYAIAKANSPLVTTTPGIFNRVFGAYAWAQLNLEANAFGVLPKFPWEKSGYRAISARPTVDTTQGNSVYGGIVENGTIPDAIIPTVKEVELKPKQHVVHFMVSEQIEALANHSKDDIWGGLGTLRLYFAVEHKKLMNQALLRDVEGEAATATGDNTGSTKNFESLDRIISSSAEEAVLGGTFNDWYDPYRDSTSIINRDGASEFDATVISPSGTIGTNGQLTDEVLRKLLFSIRKKSGKDPSVFLGSHEVYNELQSLYLPQLRSNGNAFGETLVSVDVNGIKTFNGIGVGIHLSSVYGVPFVPTVDAPRYSGDVDEVGRLFALDTTDAEGFGSPRLGIQVLIPTEYYEAGRRIVGYPFINGAFNERGIYRTSGEIVCKNFVSQGKIRDIKL